MSVASVTFYYSCDLSKVLNWDSVFSSAKWEWKSLTISQVCSKDQMREDIFKVYWKLNKWVILFKYKIVSKECTKMYWRSSEVGSIIVGSIVFEFSSVNMSQSLICWCYARCSGYKVEYFAFLVILEFGPLPGFYSCVCESLVS